MENGKAKIKTEEARKAIWELERHEIFLKGAWKPHPDEHVLDAIATAIHSLKKQTEMNTIREVKEDEGNRAYFYCPDCSHQLSRCSNYCPYCGQKLDWRRSKNAKE